MIPYKAFNNAPCIVNVLWSSSSRLVLQLLHTPSHSHLNVYGSAFSDRCSDSACQGGCNFLQIRILAAGVAGQPTLQQQIDVLLGKPPSLSFILHYFSLAAIGFCSLGRHLACSAYHGVLQYFGLSGREVLNSIPCPRFVRIPCYFGFQASN